MSLAGTVFSTWGAGWGQIKQKGNWVLKVADDGQPECELSVALHQPALDGWRDCRRAPSHGVTVDHDAKTARAAAAGDRSSSTLASCLSRRTAGPSLCERDNADRASALASRWGMLLRVLLRNDARKAWPGTQRSKQNRGNVELLGPAARQTDVTYPPV